MTGVTTVNELRSQLDSYRRRAVFRRLDLTLAYRRHLALRSLIRIWDAQGNDPTKWYPLNARMVFRNGYHERQSGRTQDAYRALTRNLKTVEGNAP